uniref:non-ribosomal peptide synthetase n=2 Tax=unclassified Caballeronia TaxID=2646786 RepID=UPI0020293373
GVPDYMVPWRIVVLDVMPLNANGKVDRKALPVPSVQDEDHEWEAPQGALETHLAQIWTTLLGIERIGRNDNFFELGGDSILGLQIVARLRQSGFIVTARQIFEQQTIAQLAAVAVETKESVIEETGETEPSNEPFPLLPVQSWFFEQAMPSRDHWNQSVLLERTTAPNLAHLDTALHALVAHHASLRLRFNRTDDGRWSQHYAPEETHTLMTVTHGIPKRDIERHCAQAQGSLDIEHGPLIRALAMSIDDGTWRLFIVIHHLAVDAVSWRILLDDLQRACAQLDAGEPIAPPPCTTSLSSFARMQHRAARSLEITTQIPYWNDVLAVPASLPRTHAHAGPPVSATIRLDRDATRRLLQDANAAYRTRIDELLLVAAGRALARFAHADGLRIDIEGHGRDVHGEHADLSRTVGWFTSLYPVVLQAQGEHAAAIKRVKEALRTAPQAGSGFGLLKYSGDDIHRAVLSSESNSDVVFNYLGQFGGTLDRDSGWQRASEQTGASQHKDATPAHALEILGQVMNGELSVTFHHRRGDRYDASTIASLSRDFEQELHALNAHCTNGAQGITPSDVPLAKLDQPALDALPIEPARIADLYPLAPMQAGIVFHSLLGEHTNAYINQLRLDLDGLDDARFIAAWQAIVARHEALRTGFIQCEDEPRQWVARSVTLPVFQEDWRDRDARDDALDTLATAQIAQGFDMAEPPLMRITLVRTGEARHHLVWTFHHALLDGWSTAQVLSDVLQYYGSNRQEATRGRYRDFIAWLARNESSRETAHAFWRGLLAPLEGPTHLAASLPRSKDDTNETFGDVTLDFDAARTAHLTRFARSQHVTLNTLVQAAWLLLLQRYTGAPTVSFGATVAGRPATLEGVERIVGLFINTVPVVGTPHAAMPVAQWLGEIQQQSVASREHEHVALNEIQRLAQLDGGQSLFDSILVFENYPLDDALRESAHDGLTFSNIAAREQTNYPLTVSITQRTGLRIDFSYARKHFDAASIERIAHHLSTLLDALTIDASRALADVSMLDKDELAHLNRIGERSTATLDATPVHRRIAAHASAHPHDTALVQGNESISFAALEQRANRIVNGLAAIGIGAEARVGIALERSIDMIAALLGVMKSGAAYVPLDPSYPAERLAYMARDSGVKLVIASQEGAFDGVSTLDVATCGEGCVDTDPHVAIHGTQLAYVIYTSGSTGQPKGVEITHDALARHTQAVTDAARITRADRVLQFSTFSFDAFVDQLFPALCMGATVVLRDETLWDSARFLHEVRSQRITVADLTTAYWSALALDFASDPKSAREALASLRRVQVGGEAMFGDSLRAWKAAGLAHVELVNMYGPSESTVTATTFDCTRYVQTQDEIPVRIPIGKPLTGRSVNVLDAQLMPVPMGVPGELYIGGELLARGYRSRPGTTAERFVPDPFSNEAGARMYRAGDIVRWNAEGELDYLARTDQQVKVRGYRVEPGEIEAQLIRMPNVREAAVIARSSRLIAFVTLDGEASSTDLRARLSEALPDYMVPAALVIVDAMPLNPAGKIDRQRLLDDDDHHDSTAQTFVPPEGETESTLARVWTEVLQVARVGRHDTFFALGGDSLAAMRTQAALRRAQIDAPLAVLMSHRPLHEMARTLSDESPAGTTSASDAASLLDLMNTL